MEWDLFFLLANIPNLGMGNLGGHAQTIPSSMLSPAGMGMPRMPGNALDQGAAMNAGLVNSNPLPPIKTDGEVGAVFMCVCGCVAFVN